MFKKIKTKSAFTLAEVLITLVIVGVIAAMTIPTLINKTQNQEFVSKLKKAYSTLTQATNMIRAEKGAVTSWNITNTSDVYNAYKKYLVNIKECNSGLADGCFNHGIKTMSNYLVTYSYLDLKGLILNDGTEVQFRFGSSDCSNNWDGSEGTCAQIVVDLNGEKGPNILGRDVFKFTLKDNGLFPTGCDDNSSNCTRFGSGSDCACKVLRENAMNY